MVRAFYVVPDRVAGLEPAENFHRTAEQNVRAAC